MAAVSALSVSSSIPTVGPLHGHSSIVFDDIIDDKPARRDLTLNPPRHPRLAALAAALHKNLLSRRPERFDRSYSNSTLDTQSLGLPLSGKPKRLRLSISLPRLKSGTSHDSLRSHTRPPSPTSQTCSFHSADLPKGNGSRPTSPNSSIRPALSISTVGLSASFTSSQLSTPPATPRARVVSAFGLGFVGELFGLHKTKGQHILSSPCSTHSTASSTVCSPTSVTGGDDHVHAKKTFRFKPHTFRASAVAVQGSDHTHPASHVELDTSSQPSFRGDPLKAGHLSTTLDGHCKIPKQPSSGWPKRRAASPPVLAAKQSALSQTAPTVSSESAVPGLPSRYEQCDPLVLSSLVASLLTDLIQHNDKVPFTDVELTRFHSGAIPGISVADYLERIVSYATIPPAVLLSVLWYLNQLTVEYPQFVISSLTSHRVLITAAMVAAKGLSDSFWTNSTYATVGGLPPRELAVLELELLRRLEWSIVPPPDVLEKYYDALVRRSRKGRESGADNFDATVVLAPSNLLV